MPDGCILMPFGIVVLQTHAGRGHVERLGERERYATMVCDNMNRPCLPEVWAEHTV